MKFFLLAAAITLSTQGLAASPDEGVLNSAVLAVSSKSSVLDFKIDDQLELAKEVSLETNNKIFLAQSCFV